MKELQPVVLKKHEFECREKTKLKKFQSEISGYEDSIARQKNKGFSTGDSSTSAMSWMDILMEQIELVVAEMKTFENPAKSKESIFRIFRTVNTLMQETDRNNHSIEKITKKL